MASQQAAHRGGHGPLAGMRAGIMNRRRIGLGGGIDRQVRERGDSQCRPQQLTQVVTGEGRLAEASRHPSCVRTPRPGR